jgi:DNA-binding response OmpR family regulator
MLIFQLNMRVETSTIRRDRDDVAQRVQAQEVPPEARRVANVTIYPHLAAVTVDGIPIAVSPKEFALVRTLFEQSGAVVTHERCFEALGTTAGSNSARLLRVYVFAVRRKLRAAGATTVIASLRGRGYVVRELRIRR